MYVVLTFALLACREHPTVPAAVPRVAQAGALNGVLGTFTKIDVPGSLSTSALGMNDHGDVVGTFSSQDGKRHGYLLRGGSYQSIDVPGATATTALGINSQGDVVGTFRGSDPAGTPERNHGFLLRDGEFTTIDPPVETWFMRAADINDDGDIVGQYNTPFGPPGTGLHDGKQHGFLLSDGEFTTLDFPDPTVNVTQVWAINPQGDMVGRADGVCCRGFVKTGDTWKFIDFPGDNVWNGEVRGINARGELLGGYSDGPPNQFVAGFHGYLMTREGVFTSFDFPGAYGTFIGKINSRGDFVGFYWTSAGGPYHGYLLTRAR
ncbi:MAG: hypothetical protein NVS1B4_12210 [Gemmatimonadaceae bacterium]